MDSRCASRTSTRPSIIRPAARSTANTCRRCTSSASPLARLARLSVIRRRIFQCADRTSSSKTASAAPYRQAAVFRRSCATPPRGYDKSQDRSGLPRSRSGNVSGSRRVVLAHFVEEYPVRNISLIFAISVGMAPAGAALAQPVGTDRVPEQGVACPPDVKGSGPTVRQRQRRTAQRQAGAVQRCDLPACRRGSGHPRRATRGRRAEGHSAARFAGW